MNSWLHVDDDSDFSIHNLPYGVFKAPGRNWHVGVAIGDYVLDLAWLYENDYFKSIAITENVFDSDSLNGFIQLGKTAWSATRQLLQNLLSEKNTTLQNATADRENALILREKIELKLPVDIGDYTDFYSSEEHATNVGKMFRPDQAPLLPNWKHIPVGYHGRASSILISGTPIKRPHGQTKPNPEEPPVFGPSKLLDFELEMAFVVGKSNKLGEAVSINEAENHIFGMVIFNDWSARDIQKWEYVPLGPFLGKSFASSISPWIVPLEALEPYRTGGPKQSPEVLPYMRQVGNHTFDIQLEVYLQHENGEAQKICNSNFKYLYWSMAQQLAHHTINGCNMQVGDVCASGTISGKTPDSFGSMLELSWKGTKPIKLSDGSERKFLQDGDTVIMRAFSKKDNKRIGFGEVTGKIVP